MRECAVPGWNTGSIGGSEKKKQRRNPLGVGDLILV